jgi:hypothetical protein
MTSMIRDGAGRGLPLALRDADTKFDDEQYTLVLTNCDVSIPVGQPTWRRVVATTGDLYTGQTGTPLAGYTGLSVNVDVTLKP